MKQVVVRIALLVTFLALCIGGTAMASDLEKMVRVGLYFDSTSLASANLENSVGTGYRFGYYDTNDNFVQLGNTSVTQISMLKTQNQYLTSSSTYSTTSSGSSDTIIGCYHIQFPESYASFDAAKTAASGVSGGFPAWISGTYYVRVGAYATKEDATSAQTALAVPNTTIVGTSCYGISITQTKTATILFQFDSGGNNIFAVNPGQDNSQKTTTWFKGYKYYGNFLYERIDGGNLTVVNYLPMDDYVKGILPYEMSASWPIEALKAQAVCARSYTVSATGSKHAADHFDICNTTCCQVYRGTNSATTNSDKAVDDTAGIYARYNGAIAQTYYYSSNGGASEDVGNVWSGSVPYLKGVKDPYEASIAKSISNYYWTVTYTCDQLTAKLKAKGYGCGNITNLSVSKFTDMGNVYAITFTDDAGKTYSFSKEKARTTLGLASMRFNIAASGGSSSSYYVDESGDSLSSLDGAYAIDGSGQVSQITDGTSAYAITSSGTGLLTTQSSGGGSFVISGSGNGHNVGLSQWGAYAMAKQGCTYDQILKFYYTGIDLY